MWRAWNAVLRRGDVALSRIVKARNSSLNCVRMWCSEREELGGSSLLSNPSPTPFRFVSDLFSRKGASRMRGTNRQRLYGKAQRIFCRQSREFAARRESRPASCNVDAVIVLRASRALSLVKNHISTNQHAIESSNRLFSVSYAQKKGVKIRLICVRYTTTRTV